MTTSATVHDRAAVARDGGHGTMHGSNASTGVVRACLVLLLCLLALLPSPARAQDDGLPIRVEVGFDDSGLTPSWVPVTIAFTADRPISGEVRVTVQDRNTDTFVRPVELAAGAPVEVRMAVPSGGIVVEVRDGEEVLASRTLRAGRGDGLLRIGVLGEEDPDGPSFSLLPAERTARWVGVDPEWVGIPQGLASLDTLVVDPDRWADLDDQGRQRLWHQAAGEGMTLVLTGPVEDPPMALSLTDPPVDATIIEDATGAPSAVLAPAGRGRVAMVAPAPGSEVWEAVAGPRLGVAPLADGEGYEAQPFAAQDLLIASGEEPEVPAIPFLGGFLLLYLVAVGPVNALLLRRARRPEWAWLTVPAVAAAFAVVPLVGGGTTGGGSSTIASQQLTWWLDGAAEERVAAAWRVTTTGDTSTTLGGAGWAATTWGGQQSQQRVIPVDDGVRLQGQSRSGEVAGVLASRPVDTSPPLEVTATVVDGQVQVEVTNVGEDRLDAAQVVAGTQVEQIGALTPGDTTDLTLSGAAGDGRPAMTGFPMQGFGQFGMATEVIVGPDGAMTEMPAPLPPMGPGFPGQGLGLFPPAIRTGTPGVAWVVARQPDTTAPLQVTGGEVSPQPTVVAVGTRVEVPADASLVPPGAILLQQVVDDSVGPGQVFGGEPMGRGLLLHADIPAVGEGLRLHGLLAPFGAGTADLWDDTARTWRTVDARFTDLDHRALLTPADGLWVRLQGFSGGSGLVLAAPGADLDGLRGIRELQPAPMPFPTVFPPTPVPTVEAILPTPTPVPTAGVGSTGKQAG